MNEDPRSLTGELARGKNNYGGLPSAPGAGRPVENKPFQVPEPKPALDLEMIRRKMIANAAQYSR